MDVLVRFLLSNNYERLTSDIRPPIVVHSVPGGGKSTLIRELLRFDSRFSSYTFGEADPPSLTGVRIRGASEGVEKAELVIFDEYLAGDWPPWAFALFADPFQGGGGRCLRAHFIKTESHRFGQCTAQLLRSLNFEVVATGEDLVQICDIYTIDPRDTVIYFEKEIGQLLARHSVEALCISQARGKTFDSVTFVTTEQGPFKDRAAAFQCLTRHRKSLLILCPDATYSST